MAVMVSPSILAADFANLEKDTKRLNESDADYIHIDIMDGIFVPNISFGFPVSKAIQKHATKPLDFHLMIERPDEYLQHCVKSGAEIISVHIEACKHLHRTVAAIQELGCKAGVAINPHTPVSQLESILPVADLILVMSVNPGFGGQKFISETVEKVRELKKMAKRLNPGVLIEIDGGVNQENGKALVEAGATMLVAGSFVFKSSDLSATISNLKSLG
ncbi:MAG: ribulose-phosphate 3-epimerase [Cyclobacteriaceae bacterium]|jgi:ribulose-phosphate 3-epimerase